MNQPRASSLRPPAVPRPVSLLLSAVLSALLAVAASLLFAAPASALSVVGHGYGHTWSVDGRSWLGSHRLADGNLGLCVQILSAPPEGVDVVYRRADTLGWYGATESARLAYIARNWAASTNQDWAAAAQLATWSITGLDGHDDAWYAQRANGAAGPVLALSRWMRQQIDGPEGASRGVAARVSLVVPSDAGGTVSSELVVTYIGPGKTQLPPGRFTGRMTLTGATFSDGSASRIVSNGEVQAITPSGGTALTDVTASVVYENLPFGDDVYVAKAPPGRQSLLVAPPGGIPASATAHAGDVSPLPFEPAVRTQTSAVEAEVGTHLSDRLELGLRPLPKLTPTTLAEWGVYRDPHGALQPVPVTIRSTLWGPFESRPVAAPDAPPHAPVVCTVSVEADDGPGGYRTPDCVLRAAGYYVWTETIDPADTPPEKGGDRFTAWKSSFGVTAEVSLAVAPPPPPVTATPTPTPTPTPPSTTPRPTPTPTPTPTALPPATAVPPAPTATPSVGATAPDGPSTPLASTGLTSGGLPLWLGAGGLFGGLAAVCLVGVRQRRRGVPQHPGSRLAQGSPRHSERRRP